MFVMFTDLVLRSLGQTIYMEVLKTEQTESTLYQFIWNAIVMGKKKEHTFSDLI